MIKEKEKFSNSNNQDFDKLSDDTLNFATGGTTYWLCGNDGYSDGCLNCEWFYLDDTTDVNKIFYYCISTTPNTLLKEELKTSPRKY
ncbi:hypothetical protein JMF89_07070 [Clostridiaceae bacterium UIB06]|uniref:Uncharacterized protein n=1 Tax=Clostridium thailandense TaxID=2794346 RepID=A0A949TU55_9CLOT|nr:hypothetical protein [Clostridium thailandense]MBV7272438.1 hypothetical protein [Clostridium thailandense]MCH5136962.1 hypothetical protein [Clostridiaceae bacterium UIB06]